MRGVWAVLLALATGTGVRASYTYYDSDSFQPINANNWTVNGTISGNAGLTSSSATGGSVISSVAVPGTPNEYEVKATISLKGSGGDYDLYLRASNDALHGPSPAGTYYVVELDNPSFLDGGCTANLTLYKRVSGVITALPSALVPCHDGMVIRAVYTALNRIEVYMDDPQPGQLELCEVYRLYR